MEHRDKLGVLEKENWVRRLKIWKRMSWLRIEKQDANMGDK